MIEGASWTPHIQSRSTSTCSASRLAPVIRRDIQFCERLADKMGKRTMWGLELRSWDDEERAGDIIM